MLALWRTTPSIRPAVPSKGGQHDVSMGLVDSPVPLASWNPTFSGYGFRAWLGECTKDLTLSSGLASSDFAVKFVIM